jgi:transcriptional/translational regulatory protein YebC/TACO1
MAGHSHSKKIKHKKELADQKRGQLFSKLLNAVAIAARENSNPQFNSRLRTAIEKARAHNVPQENIERAIQRSLTNKT